MKCRFNHTRKVLVWHDGKQVEVVRPVTGKHWLNKICPDHPGATKADAPQRQKTHV